MEKADTANDRQSTLKPAPATAIDIPGSPRRKDRGTAFGRPREFLGNRFVYAVISQRAHGLSIGINMNPDKYCNFDCRYCEVDRDAPARDRKVNVKVMSTELGNLLTLVHQKRLREFDWFSHTPDELLELKGVALSGNGEPTWCPNFTEIVREVVHLRSIGRYSFFKIVLITNATGLHLPEVRLGLQSLSSQDEIWAKLDAGTQDYMNRVNHPDVALRKVMANIQLIGRERPVIIQSLFPLIDGNETPEEEIEQYVERLLELKESGTQITLVQIYSAHRPPHRNDCGHLPLKLLTRIAQRVRDATGLKAEVF